MKLRNIAIIAHVDVVPPSRNSLKPSGFKSLAEAHFSATGKLPFSRPLSRQREQ